MKRKRFKVEYYSENGTQSDNEFIGIFDDVERANKAIEDYIAQSTIPKEELDMMLKNGEIDSFEYADHIEEVDRIRDQIVVEEIL